MVNQIGVVGPGSTTAAPAWDEQKIRNEAKKSGETIGPDSEDARIYNEVRGMLVVHEGTYKGEIFVDVVNRNVTLRGKFIGTSTARNEAIAAAQAVSGVNAVNDQLMVTATGTSSPEISPGIRDIKQRGVGTRLEDLPWNSKLRKNSNGYRIWPTGLKAGCSH